MMGQNFLLKNSLSSLANINKNTTNWRGTKHIKKEIINSLKCVCLGGGDLKCFEVKNFSKTSDLYGWDVDGRICLQCVYVCV